VSGTVDLALLRRLSEAPAPSGEERAVAHVLTERFAALGLAVRVDRLGNVVATVPGTGAGLPRTALLSHMDEVGLVVRRIEPDGFLRVMRLGGIGRRSLAARPVTLLGRSGPVPGILGVKAHHLTDPAEVQRLPPIEEAYVDLGVGSAEAARDLGIEVGTKAVFTGGFQALAGQRVSGKALDNRALCLVLLALAERLAAAPPPGEVVLVGTVREEFDMAGAAAAAAALRPDLALVLDVTPATDTPDLAGVGAIRLGGGPTVKHADFHGRGMLRGFLAPTALAERLHGLAAAAGITTQREVMLGVVTDAAETVRLPDPPATACLGLPIRYTHSPVEVIDLGDLAGLIELVEAAVRILPTEPATAAPPW
jgi:putative aminopeptidase FrvX